ncbi:MAG: TusE/DsrC/DsvC family sulfur relay protein [Gammaproteobacteria bacterium]
MGIEFQGKSIETTESGFLCNVEDWSEALAEVIAKEDGIELTQKHWDVVNYLREAYLEENGHQPNNRELLKEMGNRWGGKLQNKDLFDLFPGNPSKQAGRIAGLPESMRKGGY